MGLNIQIDAFWGAIIMLVISDSAFTAEIFRAGIQSIARGQTEAAQTIDCYFQTMLSNIVTSIKANSTASCKSIYIHCKNVTCVCDRHARTYKKS